MWQHRDDGLLRRMARVACLWFLAAQIPTTSAELPPKGMKCDKISRVEYSPELPSSQGGCQVTDFYCYIDKRYFWTEPKYLTDMPFSPTDTTSVSKGYTHTSTVAWSYGAKVDLTLGQWAGMARSIDPQIQATFSEADATSTEARTPCPAGVFCGLMAKDYKIEIIGMHYVHSVDTGGFVKRECPAHEDNRKGKRFSSFYPVMKQARAEKEKPQPEVFYFACAHGEPSKGHPQCPQRPGPDPRVGLSPKPPLPPPPPPPENKPGPRPPAGEQQPGPCNVDGRAGFCKGTAACRSEGRVSLAGKPDSNGKWPCIGGGDIQCCVEKQTPAQEETCRVNNRRGVCKDTGACKREGKEALEGVKDKNGKWPCKGGANIQCCARKQSGLDGVLDNLLPPPSDSQPDCTVDGRRGVCMDIQACEKGNKESLPGKEDPKTGKWPCEGGKNIQCCVAKLGAPPPLPLPLNS